MRMPSIFSGSASSCDLVAICIFALTSPPVILTCVRRAPLSSLVILYTFAPNDAGYFFSAVSSERAKRSLSIPSRRSAEPKKHGKIFLSAVIRIHSRFTVSSSGSPDIKISRKSSSHIASSSQNFSSCGASYSIIAPDSLLFIFSVTAARSKVGISVLFTKTKTGIRYLASRFQSVRV